MATHHPTPQVCPVLFIIATTNYNITLFFLTQESIMGCKEIRSRVRIYLFLNVSIKIIETIGATLLVINKVGPPFHCSARRPWERTTYVGYPEPSLWGLPLCPDHRKLSGKVKVILLVLQVTLLTY